METKTHCYYNKLSGEVKERYADKILKCGGLDPYLIKPGELSENPEDFPSISMNDIENYMIHAISPFTKTFHNNFKGTEAHSFFESGFVLYIGSKKQENLAIVTGKVKHSQRMNEPPLRVWILANMNGEIICAHCTCIGGLSETCSHVGAVCFAVKSVVESSESIKSVTDVLCKWNFPKAKGVPMSRATEINWRIPACEQSKLETSFFGSCDSITLLSDERINQFIKKCHTDGDVTALETILLPSKIRRKTNLRDEIFLSSLFDHDKRKMPLFELVKIGKSFSLNLTNEEVEEISSLTLPQLKSNVSLALRRGRITETNFKRCCETDINNPSLSIRHEICPTAGLGDRSDLVSIKYKKRTIKQYIQEMELNHEHFLYEESGLKINPNLPYLAGLPDGLVCCNCHGNGCMKTKYLKSLVSDESLEAFTIKPNNVFNKHGDTYTLEETHDFFYQAQFLVNVIGLDYCDFVVWSQQKTITLRVNADDQFWKTAIKKALVIHEDVFMPELLGKYFTEKLASNVSLAQNEEHLYDPECDSLGLEEECEHYKETLIGLEIEILKKE